MEASELNALIANNIGDLEAALTRALDDIDPQLNAEAWGMLKQALTDADYHFEDDENPDEAWFAPRSWLDADGDSDPWFRLTTRASSMYKTWLAHYVAAPSEQDAIGIRWFYNSLYVRDYKAILAAHSDELEQIEQAGFHRDGNSIYLPVSFDIAKVAEGFKEGDLSEALAPIAKAAEALEKARPAFQRLRDVMVAKANE